MEEEVEAADQSFFTMDAYCLQFDPGVRSPLPRKRRPVAYPVVRDRRARGEVQLLKQTR